jgi:hypothetical protein
MRELSAIIGMLSAMDWNAVRDQLESLSAIAGIRKQFANILPKLGELPLDWNKPLKDWSKDEIVGFLTNAVSLVLTEDPNLPPFMNGLAGAIGSDEPLLAVRMSPSSMPAEAAGLPGSGRSKIPPYGSGIPRLKAKAAVIGLT